MNSRRNRFRHPSPQDRNVIAEARWQERIARAAGWFADALGVTVSEMWAAYEQVQRPGTWAGKGGEA